MKKGYLTPPVLISLGLIIFFVAGTIFANKLLFNKKNQTPTENQTPPEVQEQQSDETANWKQYINKEHSFSFKFPKDWNFKREVINNSEGMINNFFFYKKDLTGFTLSVYKNSQYGNTADEYLKYWQNETQKSQATLNISSEEKIIGNNLYGIQMETSGVDVNRQVLVNNINVLLRFHINSMVMAPKDIKEVQITLNQILTTFKFLD